MIVVSRDAETNWLTEIALKCFRDVNGPQKCKNFIDFKYEELFFEMPYHMHNLSEGSNDNETLYCLC